MEACTPTMRVGRARRTLDALPHVRACDVATCRETQRLIYWRYGCEAPTLQSQGLWHGQQSPMTTPEIRLLTPQDTDAYVEIRREMLVDSPLSFVTAPEEFEANIDEVVGRFHKSEHPIAGAFVDGRLRATAGLYRSPRLKCRHRANIWGVYVGPELRGKGIGRQVIQLVIDTARAWQGVRVISLSYRDGAAGAGTLYESLGFKPWGVEPEAMWVDGAGHDEIYMQLTLTE